MRRLASPARLAATALLAVVALAASPRTAGADGSYFTLGMGPGEVENELHEYVGNDTFRVRVGLGHRFGRWALEAFLAGDIPEDYDTAVGDLDTVGVDLKYIVQLSDRFQGYVRGSASRMSTEATFTDTCFDCAYGGREYSGRGLGAGAGMMMRGKVRALGFLYWPLFFVPAGPKVNASLYLDHGYDFYRLHPHDGRGGAIDATVMRWTFGFTVGKDF
jgi:hypothetical protein